jgi:hypothetical protein
MSNPFEREGEARDNEPETLPEPPWAPCSCVAEHDLPKTVTCALCKGLGLDLPVTWLASPWSILMMLPEESFAPRTPEGFLALVLDQVYPEGGYRVLPHAHVKFSEAVKFVDHHLTIDGIAHTIIDAGRGVFSIAQARDSRAPHDAPQKWLVRHLAPLLLERMPSRVVNVRAKI